jgi:hypothetical protein
MEHSATRTILAILKIGVLIPTSLAVENTKVAYDVIQGNPQFLNSAAYHNVHLAYAMAYFGVCGTPVSRKAPYQLTIPVHCAPTMVHHQHVPSMHP